MSVKEREKRLRTLRDEVSDVVAASPGAGAGEGHVAVVDLAVEVSGEFLVAHLRYDTHDTHS